MGDGYEGGCTHKFSLSILFGKGNSPPESVLTGSWFDHKSGRLGSVRHGGPRLALTTEVTPATVHSG